MRFGFIAAAAAGVLLAFGSTASAEPASSGSAEEVVPVATVSAMVAQAECSVVSVSGDGGAFACWNPTGEHLYNCDGASDGHHPELFYYRSTSPDTRRHLSDSPGYGYCVDHNLADIPESGWIRVKACNYEKDTQLSCDSAYRYAYANG